MKSFVLATGLAAIAFADGHATATNSTEAEHSDAIHIDVHSDDDALQMLLDLVAEFCSHEESDHDMDHHDMDHDDMDHDDMDHDMLAHEDQGMMAEGDMMAEGEMTFNTEEHHDMDGDAISGHDSDHDGSDSDHDGSDSDDDHHDVADRWMCRHAMKMLHEYTEYHNSDEEGKRHRAGEWGHDMAEAAHQMGWFADGATGMVTYGTAVVAAVATLFF